MFGGGCKRSRKKVVEFVDWKWRWGDFEEEIKGSDTWHARPQFEPSLSNPAEFLAMKAVRAFYTIGMGESLISLTDMRTSADMQGVSNFDAFIRLVRAAESKHRKLDTKKREDGN